ncbi:hypothetical protein TNCV_4162111 [Trichonephila clavipes]|nr:hypothetical protein TNCV_4162111 [Trichonephila clavipes]
MPYQQLEMSPKKGKKLRRTLEHLKMGNEFMCQFIPVSDIDQTILLTPSPRNRCERGSRVVKVLDRGWACHEFKPSTTINPPCRV